METPSGSGCGGVFYGVDFRLRLDQDLIADSEGDGLAILDIGLGEEVGGDGIRLGREIDSHASGFGESGALPYFGSSPQKC